MDIEVIYCEEIVFIVFGSAGVMFLKQAQSLKSRQNTQVTPKLYDKPTYYPMACKLPE